MHEKKSWWSFLDIIFVHFLWVPPQDTTFMPRKYSTTSFFGGKDLILREGAWFSHQRLATNLPTRLFPLTHLLLRCHFARGKILRISDQRTNIPFDCDSSKAGSVRDSTIFDISEHLKVRNFLFPFSPAPTLPESQV